MTCSNCGSPVPPGAVYCPTCGALTTGAYTQSGTSPNDATVASSLDNAPPPPPSTSYGGSPYGTGTETPYSTPPAPYGAYNVTPRPAPQPSPPPAPRRWTNRFWLLVIAVLLVVMLVVGGVLAFALRSNSPTASPPGGSTPGLSPAQITATARENLTATANAGLTATAQANLAATASVTAGNQNPYAAGGTLAILDPLRDNSLGFGWDEGSFSDGGCTFSEGAYHANTVKTNAFHYCVANSATYGNFTFEAQVRIIKGDCGGLIFRADSNTGKLYLFEVCQDGSYNFYMYKDASGNSTLLANASSSAIKSGLNQVNVLAITARGDAITLYVNRQKITSITNNAYSHGQIALVADSFNNPTEVVFSNARLWKF